MNFGIPARHLQRARGDIDGRPRPCRAFCCQRDRDTAAPGSKVKETKRSACLFFLLKKFQHRLYEMFRFRAWDKGRCIDGKIPPVELTKTENVGQRLTCGTTCQKRIKMSFRLRRNDFL